MEPVSGMAALLASVTAFVTSAVSWVGTWASAITSEGNEILLLACVAVPLAGFGIGAIRRLVNIRA